MEERDVELVLEGFESPLGTPSRHGNSPLRNMSSSPNGSLGGVANPTIVGITAPTKEDWSNEFELASGQNGFVVATATGHGTAQEEEINLGNILSVQPTNRARSRRIVRSLDWGKIQAIHQLQTARRIEDDLPESLNEDHSHKFERRSLDAPLKPPHPPPQQQQQQQQHQQLRPQRAQSVGLEPLQSRALPLKRTGSGNGSSKDILDQTSFRSADSQESVSARRIRRQQVAKVQLKRITNSSNDVIRDSKEEEDAASRPRLSSQDDINVLRSTESNDDLGSFSIDLQPKAQGDVGSLDMKTDDEQEEATEDEEVDFSADDDDDDVHDDDGEDNEDGDGNKDDSDSLSSASDWDAMLEEEEAELNRMNNAGEASSNASSSAKGGASFQQHLEGLRSLVGEKPTDEVSAGQIPSRWKFTTQIKQEKPTPTVLRYPKPTALYSLRTKDGRRFMQETALEKWLNDLVSNDDLSTSTQSPKSSSIFDSLDFNTGSLGSNSSTKTMRKVLGRTQPGTLEWAENFLSLIWGHFSMREDGFCAESCLRLFRMLGTLATENRKRRLGRKSFSSAGTSSITTPSGGPDSATSKEPSSATNDSSSNSSSGKPGMTGRSHSVEMDIDSSDESSSRSWDRFLGSVMSSFNLGVMALARTGAAFEAGDMARSRGTSRESVPGCVTTMVLELRRWIAAQVPVRVMRYIESVIMLAEAEAVAHQLATCVLDFTPTPGNNANADNEGSQHGSSNNSRRRKLSKDFIMPGHGRRKSASGAVEEQPQSLSPPSSPGIGFQKARTGRNWEFVYEPPRSSAIKFLSNEAQLAEAVLAQYCNIYMESVKAPEVALDDFGEMSVHANPIIVQARCLCDIQLLLCGMSPLTSTETNKLQDALDQLQLELEDWMTSDESVEREVIEIVEDDEAGISMCIGVVHCSRELIECEQLCSVDPAYRMKKLQDLYPQIPSQSMIKARAAYVLAMYLWDEHRDSEKAEELLFESLFILQNLKAEIPDCQKSALLNELATNAMVLYGDILVENSKYKYAIGSYESAVRSYKIRERTDFKWLYRRLCNICVQHMDWDRALKYHLEILHTTKLETSLNEFVYVSERVAMMLLNQRADFAQAESYLKLALSYLGTTRRSPSLGDSTALGVGIFMHDGSSDGKNAVPVSANSDAHHYSLRVKLQQRLAHVLLAANRAEDAARLLSQIIASSPISFNNINMIQGTTSTSSTTGGTAFASPTGVGGTGATSAGGVRRPTSPAMSTTSMSGASDAGMVGGSDQPSPEIQQSITTGTRITLFLLLSRCCLKLRWLADCTIILDQLAHEVTVGRWCDPSYYATTTTRPTIELPARPRPTELMAHDLIAILATFSTEIALTYATIRARAAMYQGHPEEGLLWLDTTLRLAGLNPKAKLASSTLRSQQSSIMRLTLGQIGRLYYYRGKVLQLVHCPGVLGQIVDRQFSEPSTKQEIYKHCVDCGQAIQNRLNSSGGSVDSASVVDHRIHFASNLAHSTSSSGDGSKLFHGGSQHHPHHHNMSFISISDAFGHDPTRGFLNMDHEEKNHMRTETTVMECIDSFLCAFEYFRLIDDALWQAKALARVAQVELFQLLRLETRVASQMEDELDRIEEIASMSIDLCSDIGYAPLMIRCLLNMVELNLIRGESPRAASCWNEARQLLNTLYLTSKLSASPTLVEGTSFTENAASIARMEMEQALSQFISLSKSNTFSMSNDGDEKSTNNNNKKLITKSSSSNTNEEFLFPEARVPGIHTQPGLTCRMLEHVTRLVRCMFHDNNSTIKVIRHDGVLASWNWLSDECWRQHAYCARVVLQEHVRSSLYEEYLHYNLTTTVVVKKTRIFSTAAASSETSTSDGLRSSFDYGSASQHHRRNKSDSIINNTNLSSGGGSSLLEFGRGAPGGLGGHANRQKERGRQMKQHLVYEDHSCKRCQIAHQAELMTTEGRTNPALWSCFHRLKLLAHGEIGHSMHMEEVRTQNIELLRRIRSLAHATKPNRPNTPFVSQSPASPEKFRSPLRNASEGAVPQESADAKDDISKEAPLGPLKNYVLFNGWDGVLVTVKNRRQISPDDEDEMFPRVEKYMLEPMRPLGGLNFQRLEENTWEHPFHRQQIVDAVPSLYGLWDVLRSCTNDSNLFQLISVMLGEKPIVVVSSLCSVRSRAIESMLALIRPFQWLHILIRNIPAVSSYAMGRMLGCLDRKKSFIVGMHPSAVANFLGGYHSKSNVVMSGSSTEMIVVDNEVPTILNLDDRWVQFGTSKVQLLPGSFQSLLLMKMNQGQQRGGSSSTNNTGTATSQGNAFSISSSTTSPLQGNVDGGSPLEHAKINGSNTNNSNNNGQVQLTWGIEARARCQAVYEGMGTVMMWLLRLHPYFYDNRTGIFDVESFTNAMSTEDPRGLFCAEFTRTKMFEEFLHEKEARKTLSRLKLDDAILYHMKQKAKVYRSLVGLTRGCWVWMVILDHTVDRDSGGSLLFGSNNTLSSSGKSTVTSTGTHGSQWSTFISTFGGLVNQSSSSTDHGKKQAGLGNKNATIARIAEDIQYMQLRNIKQGEQTGNEQGTTFFQGKPKKKWIYLEEKRLRYHYRRSKTREKGAIVLDPKVTRLIVPTSHYVKKDSPNDLDRVQNTLERTRKTGQQEVIEDPRPGSRDDSHWIYLVTQLKEPNRARTIKLRFLDKMEENLWLDAIRVKLMNPELLIRMLETAYIFNE